MSVRVSTIVWKHFPFGGTRLLVMLALADWADESGDNIYPAMSTIGQKARISERHARRVVHKLRRDGWLVMVRAGGGRGNTNVYRIALGRLQKQPD